MAVCTFFGHRDCPDTIQETLLNELIKLIKNCSVDMFYVGNQGKFDTIVCKTLNKLKKIYTNIDYVIVLAYMPRNNELLIDDIETILPEGIELVPPRYAISWRNNWMLKQADYVITYITHSFGGAAQYANKAERAGKIVINLAKIPE